MKRTDEKGRDGDRELRNIKECCKEFDRFEGCLSCGFRDYPCECGEAEKWAFALMEQYFVELSYGLLSEQWFAAMEANNNQILSAEGDTPLEAVEQVVASYHNMGG